MTTANCIDALPVTPAAPMVRVEGGPWLTCGHCRRLTPDYATYNGRYTNAMQICAECVQSGAYVLAAGSSGSIPGAIPREDAVWLEGARASYSEREVRARYRRYVLNEGWHVRRHVHTCDI